MYVYDPVISKITQGAKNDPQNDPHTVYLVQILLEIMHKELHF